MSRTTIKVTYQHEQLTLRQLAKVCGLNFKTVKWRYSEGFRDAELWRAPRESSQHSHPPTVEANPRREAEQAKREKARAELERVLKLPLGAILGSVSV